jgi:hypothetical protein
MHAARGGVRRRESGARIAPRLAEKPGRPPTRLCDACITGADELRACAALSNLFYVLLWSKFVRRVSHARICRSSTNVHPIALLSIL